jgi:hypothetical protein
LNSQKPYYYTTNLFAMSIPRNDYEGLWRASANEGVPYSDDYPESFLVLPEWIDGALGAGKASVINIYFDLTDPKKCELIVEDNGKGLINQNRMLGWSSNNTASNETENVYGHGSKKALTKFMPNYRTASWSLAWRTQDKKGVSSSLNMFSSPFMGLETKHEQDDDDEDMCKNSGLRWKLEFDISVLGKLNEPKSLMAALQEIIRIRYEPSYFQDFVINIKIKNGTEVISKNSNKWKSLKQSLEEKVASGSVTKLYEFDVTDGETNAKCTLFEIEADGRKFNIQGIPNFGKKNMKATRIHIGRGGRYIEAMPYSKFIGIEAHNFNNGLIGFINFTGEQPIPCTTKVKMHEECPIFKKMLVLIRKQFKRQPIKTPAPVTSHVPVPVPAPVPAPVAAPVQEKTKAKKSAQVAASAPVPAPVPATVPSQVPVPVPVLKIEDTVFAGIIESGPLLPNETPVSIYLVKEPAQTISDETPTVIVSQENILLPTPQLQTPNIELIIENAEADYEPVVNETLSISKEDAETLQNITRKYGLKMVLDFLNE